MDLFWIALLLPLGVLGQAVMGGLTVIYGLDPGWVIGHFLLSMLLLVACVALAWRASFEPGERPRSTDKLSVWSVRFLLLPGFLTLSLGTIATAAGPHAGGEGTGDVVPRLDWRGAETLDWAIHQHGALATFLGLAAVGVWFLVRARRMNAATQNAMTAVCVLLACQGLVGVGAVLDGAAGRDRLVPRRAERADLDRAAGRGRRRGPPGRAGRTARA